jgi:hypothetical protein
MSGQASIPTSKTTASTVLYVFSMVVAHARTGPMSRACKEGSCRKDIERIGCGCEIYGGYLARVRRGASEVWEEGATTIRSAIGKRVYGTMPLTARTRNTHTYSTHVRKSRKDVATD